MPVSTELHRDGSINLLLDFFPRDPGTGLQVRWAEEEEVLRSSPALAGIEGVPAGGAVYYSERAARV